MPRATFRRAITVAALTAVCAATSTTGWASETQPREATPEEFANITQAIADRDAMAPLAAQLQAALEQEGNGNKFIPCSEGVNLPSYALFVQLTGKEPCDSTSTSTASTAAAGPDLSCTGQVKLLYIQDSDLRK